MASPAHNLTLEVSGGLSITGSNITVPPNGETTNAIAYDELNPVFNRMVVTGLKSDEGLDKFFTNEINGALEVGGLIVCGSATFNQLAMDKPHILSSSVKLVDSVFEGITEEAKLQIQGLGTMTTGSAETIIDLGDGFE
mgnify:CR=1 FL=1